MTEFQNALTHNDLLIFECGDVIVFDRSEQVLYSTVDTHGRALLNPLVDLRTHIGHSLLWSRQRELECSVDELRSALSSRPRTLLQETPQWRVWETINCN